MRSSTLRDSRTPSAAVGSSRMTTCDANAAARADGDRLPLPARHQADRCRELGQRHAQAIEHDPRLVAHRAPAQHAQARAAASVGPASSRPA